jgi:hypothetical protein
VPNWVKALTYWPGQSFPAPLSTVALMTTVPEPVSTVESIKLSVPTARGAVSPGAVTATGSLLLPASAALKPSRLPSGIEKATRSGDICVMVTNPPAELSEALTRLPTEVLTVPTRPSMGARMVM